MNKQFNLFCLNPARCGFIRLVILSLLICISNPCWAQSQYFTGDGGKGMSLGIQVPEGKGLNAALSYIPSMVQGCLVYNIRKYSAITPLDPVALDKVIMETLNAKYEDNLDIVRLGHVTHVGFWMTGKIIETPYGYTLQFNITDTTSNAKTIAAYNGNCTASQLIDQSAIQLASMELLTQMGVQLTVAAKNELSTTNTQQSIKAQSFLANSRTAERQGMSDITVYFNAVMAAKFDPNLPEAANRSAILAANISSGRIGDDLRNDVQWRKDWMARLAETEQYVKNYNNYYYKYYTDYYNNFYKEYNASWDSLIRQENAILNQRSAFINSLPAPPYTLYYAVDMRNSGVIDYKNETTSFTGIKSLLRGGSADWKQSIEKAVQTVNVSEWEMLKAENELKGKVGEVEQMVQTEQANIEAAIQEVVFAVNEGLNATGRREVWLLQPLNISLTKVQFNFSLLKTTKPDVPPIKKSGSTSFSVTVELLNSKNKVIGTNTFKTGGTYSITGTGASVSDDERNTVDFPKVNVNDITDNLTIRIASVNGTPAEIASKNGLLQIQAVNAAEWNSEPWNYRIQKGQITQYIGKGGSVTIPSIIWGEAVTSIGANAFANSQLTSVTIPNSVTAIGNNAFGNQLTGVTIGANLTLGSSAIGSGFEEFYNSKGKLAGTYKRHDSNSSARDSNRRNNNIGELDFSFDPATGTITGCTVLTGFRYDTVITIPKTISGIPVTAIGNNVFNLSKSDSSKFHTLTINIGKGVKFDNSAFIGSNFGEYYTRKKRAEGTYTYRYINLFSTKYAENPFTGIFVLLMGGGKWEWEYAPEWQYIPNNN